jgi:hypothetical protein
MPPGSQTLSRNQYAPTVVKDRNVHSIVGEKQLAEQRSPETSSRGAGMRFPGSDTVFAPVVRADGRTSFDTVTREIPRSFQGFAVY